MGHMYGNRNELGCLKDARKITWIFHAFLKKRKVASNAVFGISNPVPAGL